jgi:hypothetical protein
MFPPFYLRLKFFLLLFQQNAVSSIFDISESLHLNLRLQCLDLSLLTLYHPTELFKLLHETDINIENLCVILGIYQLHQLLLLVVESHEKLLNCLLMLRYRVFEDLLFLLKGTDSVGEVDNYA